MLFKAHDRHDVEKADSSFSELHGLEMALAMEDTYAAEQGVAMSRSDRRLVPSFKWKTSSWVSRLCRGL